MLLYLENKFKVHLTSMYICIQFTRYPESSVKGVVASKKCQKYNGSVFVTLCVTGRYVTLPQTHVTLPIPTCYTACL